MGKIKRGILGGFSGKVANVIGGNWKGIAYMRSQPLSVAQPNTAKQLNARENLTLIVAMAVALLGSTIKPLMDRAAVAMSGYNLFIQKNISCFVGGVFNALTAPFIVISEGKMDNTEITNVTCSAATGILTVQWLDDANAGFKLATDVSYLAVITDEGIVTGDANEPGVRSNLSASIINVDGILGSKLHVYLAFRRFDGLVVGKTSYHAVIIGA